MNFSFSLFVTHNNLFTSYYTKIELNTYWLRCDYILSQLPLLLPQNDIFFTSSLYTTTPSTIRRSNGTGQQQIGQSFMKIALSDLAGLNRMRESTTESMDDIHEIMLRRNVGVSDHHYASNRSINALNRLNKEGGTNTNATTGGGRKTSHHHSRSLSATAAFCSPVVTVRENKVDITTVNEELMMSSNKAMTLTPSVEGTTVALPQQDEQQRKQENISQQPPQIINHHETKSLTTSPNEQPLQSNNTVPRMKTQQKDIVIHRHQTTRDELNNTAPRLTTITNHTGINSSNSQQQKLPPRSPPPHPADPPPFFEETPTQTPSSSTTSTVGVLTSITIENNTQVRLNQPEKAIHQTPIAITKPASSRTIVSTSFTTTEYSKPSRGMNSSQKKPTTNSYGKKSVPSSPVIRKSSPPAVAPKPKRSVVSLNNKSQSSSVVSLNHSSSRESLEGNLSNEGRLHCGDETPIRGTITTTSSKTVYASVLKRVNTEEERAQSLPATSPNKGTVLMPMTNDMFYDPIASSASHSNNSGDELKHRPSKTSVNGNSSVNETSSHRQQQQHLEHKGARHMTQYKRHSASIRSLPDTTRLPPRDYFDEHPPWSQQQQVTLREHDTSSNEQQQKFPRVNSSTHDTNFSAGSSATWDISLTKHKPITRHKSTMV